MFKLAQEENDNNVVAEVDSELKILKKKIDKLYIKTLLNGKDDDKNAILSINAGAGGIDSQDWAEILFRMYTRWCKEKEFNLKIIDYQSDTAGGIKSVTCIIEGDLVFGHLKTENGIHRLVRISPFNANKKRHTSFASVFVYPEISNNADININSKDLKIDVFRASGAGGQHVNKTNSAVRITHIPTHIVVQCQQESSQHRNKDIAMKVLKARLYELEEKKKESKLEKMNETKTEIAWGNQIRSYVMHPYQMVKDHRTNVETGNINMVFDGNIDFFIEAALFKDNS